MAREQSGLWDSPCHRSRFDVRRRYPRANQFDRTRAHGWTSFGIGVMTRMRSMTASAALSWTASLERLRVDWISGPFPPRLATTATQPKCRAARCHRCSSPLPFPRNRKPRQRGFVFYTDQSSAPSTMLGASSVSRNILPRKPALDFSAAANSLIEAYRPSSSSFCHRCARASALSSVGSALVLTSAGRTPSGVTTVFRHGRRRMVSGTRTVILAAAGVTPPPAAPSAPRRLGHEPDLPARPPGAHGVSDNARKLHARGSIRLVRMCPNTGPLSDDRQL